MIWVESQDTQTDMKNMEWARGDSLWKLRWPVFLVSQMVKNPPAGGLGSIPGLGRSPGEGNGSSLQYSCLENSMDRGA